MAADLLNVTFLSLIVSGTATLLAALMGIPLGSIMGLRNFRGKGLVKTVTYTLYGLPPVVAGLVIFILISNSGPLGSLELLFTPAAMILAQTIIVFPIITGLTMSAVSDVSGELRETAITLGANEKQVMKTVLHDARVGISSAVMIGFGRAIAEVGAVIIVGGNIMWHTRVLTTAIVLETRRGNFEYGIMLGIVLMSIAMLVFYILKRYQDQGAEA